MNSRTVMKLVLGAVVVAGACLSTSCRPAAKQAASASPTNEPPSAPRLLDTVRLFNRAVSSYNGNGVPQDRTNAFNLFLKAAKENYPEAEARVGWMYLVGDVVDKDEKQAAHWLEKSAKAGYAKAQNDYGVLYQRGIGMTNNFGSAVELYESAAKQELAPAQYNDAIMYLGGLGVDRDNKKAADWMRKAAEHNYRRAQVALGNMAVEGCGTKQDYADAFQWFLKAAEQSNLVAAGTVGTMDHEGIGTTNNLADAVQWLQVAADQGDAQAEEELAGMHLAGEGVAFDLPATVKLLQQSAAQNYAPAQFELGLLEEAGLGVAKDPDRAFRLYRQAAAGGYDLARLYASFYERDHLRQALVTDTVVLNSGEIVTGQLDDETPTNVQIEVANATRTIYTARLIPKADIKSLQRESTEHKEQRPLVEELLKYKLSPDQEFTAKVYADAIARFNGFLKRYPQSDFAPGLQAIRDAWQYEADQLAKGSVKFAGVWMNPDTKRVLLAAREKQVDAVRQASPQHKLKKPAEIQDLLQATQADWVEACGQLSAAIGAGASQAAKVPKLQQAFDGLLPHIATYQRELGIQVGDESLSGGKNRTIGYSDMETMIQAILAGAAGVGTWPGGELSVMETPTRPVPVQVHNAGPFGPLLNPGRGN